MKKEILKGIIISFSFILTTMLTIISYATWVNLSTQSNGTTITETIWNDVINKINTIGNDVENLKIANNSSIPTGFVGSFNLSTCPTGWIPADGTNGTPDLRGAFIRGLNGNINGRDVARTLGDYQVDDFKSHNHTLGNRGDSSLYSLANGSTSYSALSNGWNGAVSGNVGGTETRPKNIALLYCVKQ